MKGISDTHPSCQPLITRLITPHTLMTVYTHTHTCNPKLTCDQAALQNFLVWFIGSDSVLSQEVVLLEVSSEVARWELDSSDPSEWPEAELVTRFSPGRKLSVILLICWDSRHQSLEAAQMFFLLVPDSEGEVRAPTPEDWRRLHLGIGPHREN